MFQAQHEQLAHDHPEWGRIAVLPWDAEIFGFAVADYQPGEIDVILRSRNAVRERLHGWAQMNDTHLIACSVTADEAKWRTLLPALGFTYVDTTFVYTVPKLQASNFARKHAPVRLATREDEAAVLRICETGFRAGRYHADARFPLALAQRRYQHWLAREFETLGENNRVYVIGDPGAPIGFTHARVNGTDAYLSIGGADPAVQSTVLPFSVFIGTLEALRDGGVRRVESKLSAGNMPMLNLSAYAGSRFSKPEHVYHWHAAGSPHLVAFDQLATEATR